ncbi:transglycosylase [Rhodanobacter sp. B04]|uniref:GlsB/YeaQ/YmgE family stress response membrane protein n=1 Tax=Rhodanobacter sp. B04 TaxID=1945860 RepID=UPI0009859B8E|nr:GlsB/YeaQ/YmgE family stress response membrane protein [Rhodanobacter sp. B04]OOG63381.1 transglycosylase [Rhodanobacter sp. B04]
MFHLIWSIIVGFFVGLIARAILPGADHMGFWMTAGVGIVGSLIGGLIGNMIKRPDPGAKFHPAGFLMSIIGAIILLLVLRYVFHM